MKGPLTRVRSTPGERTGTKLNARSGKRASTLQEGRRDLNRLSGYGTLIRYLVSSSLRTENAGTVFGFVWWVLNPLLLMAVYYVFVDIILKRGGPDYPVFVFTGLIAWQFFSKSARNAVNVTIRKERSMRQVAFPKTVIPLSETFAEFAHFGFGLLVLLAFALPFGIYPSEFLLLVLPIALIQLLFTLGVAFFLSALNVYFRDTSNLMDYGFQLWFFLSPALYPISAVPESIRPLYELVNPFATFFPAYRSVVMNQTWPDFAALGILAAVSAAVLVLGYLFFVRLQSGFIKLV